MNQVKMFLIFYLSLNQVIGFEDKASSSIKERFRNPFLTKYEPLLKFSEAAAAAQRVDHLSPFQTTSNAVEMDSVRVLNHCFTMDTHGHTFKVLCHSGATNGFDSKAKLVFRTRGGRIEERLVSDYTRTSIEGIVDGQEGTSRVRGRFSDGVFEGFVSTNRETYYVEPTFRYGSVKWTGHSLSAMSSSIVYKASDVTLCPDSFQSDKSYDDDDGDEMEETDDDEEEDDKKRFYDPEVDDYDDQQDDLTVTPDDDDDIYEDEYHPSTMRPNQKRNKATTPSTRPKRPVIVYSVSQRKREMNCFLGRDSHSVTDSKRHEMTLMSSLKNMVSSNPVRGPIGTKCLVKVWADNSFFEKYAMRDRSVTVTTVQTIISEVDRTFSEIDFNGDGIKDGYSIKIGHLEVIEDPRPTKHGPRFLSTENDPDSFLNSIQDESLDDFCLGIVITYKDFGGSLGQAYLASSEKEKTGGICSKRITLRDGSLENHNTLFVTLMGGQENNVPLAAATVTTTHLVGHSWGANHDTTGPCSKDNQMKKTSYVMGNGRFLSGTFSKCSIRDMNRIIESKAVCFI